MRRFHSAVREFWITVAHAITAHDAWVIRRYGRRSGREQINPQWALEWLCNDTEGPESINLHDFIAFCAENDLEDARTEWPEFYAYHVNKQRDYSCANGS